MGIIKDNIKIAQKINKTLKKQTEPVTGEVTEQLRMRPSRERKRPRDDHVILCSTFEFLF
jgi:hypothetical protein